MANQSGVWRTADVALVPDAEGYIIKYCNIFMNWNNLFSKCSEHVWC